MNTSFLSTGMIILLLGIQAVMVEHAVALASFDAPLPATTLEQKTVEPGQILQLNSGSTFEPPDNGGPDSSQGSGTR